jgi:tRNA(His) 5'-end guanylyltransferase
MLSALLWSCVAKQDTVSSDKNELLFSQFGINYNSLPELYRKGTILLKQPVVSVEHSSS